MNCISLTYFLFEFTMSKGTEDRSASLTQCAGKKRRNKVELYKYIHSNELFFAVCFALN